MKRGFTLVELLIVIVVISILASVTVVAFGAVRKNAVNSTTASSLSTLEKALRIYKQTEGAPLYAADQDLATYGQSSNAYYLAHWGMQGVCIAQAWPSLQEIADQIEPNDDGWVHNMADNNNEEGVYSRYCSGSPGPFIQAIKATINRSEAASSFPKMPTVNLVELEIRNTDESTQKVDVRGIRYAYNGSVDAPISYLYYPMYGKNCIGNDVTIRFSNTIGGSVGVGPGGVWSGFSETGGDYTANDTSYCLREIKY